MAGTADLGNWFKKRLNDASRVYDELNQFDGGKNWNQRTVPAKGKGAPGALGQIGHGIVRPVGQFMNTAAAQVPQSYYTGLGAIAQARGDQPGLRNAIQMQHHANSMFGDKGGLFNAGTYYNAADARRGDLKTGALKIGGGVAQTGATVMPFAKGGSVLVGFGKQPLKQVAKTAIPKLAGEGAAYGAAFSGGHQLQNNGKIDPKQLAVDTALGATFNVAAPFAIRGGRNAAVATAKAGGHAARYGFERGLENVTKNADTVHVNANLVPGATKQLDNQRVTAYENQIANGDNVAPIIIRKNKQGGIKVIDGEHRAEAYRNLGLPVPTRAVTANELKDTWTRANRFTEENLVPGGTLGAPLGKGVDDGFKYSPVENTFYKKQANRDPSGAQLNEISRLGGTRQPQNMEEAGQYISHLQQNPVQAPLKVTKNSQQVQVPKDKNVKLSKFANTTVQNSDEVSTPLKGLVKDEQVSYTPHTNEARLATADAFLKGKSNDKAYTGAIRAFDNKNANDQDVVNAIAAAKKLDASGKDDDLLKATEIYSTLSEHLTKRGQEVQAASLLSNRTPQGLYYGAVRDLKKSGIEVTPQVQKEVKNLVNEIKKFDPASDEAGFARYNLAKYVSGKIPSGMAGKVVNIWRAGLLTAVTTTGGNVLGNTGEATVRKFFVNPIATGADIAMSKVTGKRSIALGGGFATGAKDGAVKLPRFMKTGYDERNALSKYDTKETNYGDGPIGTQVGRYVNGVYRLMSLADQPFWYGARNESLAGIAKVEAMNKGLKGEAADKFMNEFLDNPPTSAMELATKEAKYGTFQNPTVLGGIATGIKSAAEKYGGDLGRAVADFFIPFTQVPASIATRVVQRTPVGTAAEVVRQIVNVRNGKGFDQRTMAKSIGEGAFGSSVFAAGYSLANSDLLTFGYPEDSKERELWEAEGKQPYSVRVGDRWYSLNYLQPFGTLLAVGGEVANAVKEGAPASEAITRGIGTAGQAVMNQSFLKGISGVLDAIDNPQQYAENWVENTASSIIPNIIRSEARAQDPYQRDVKGTLEGIQSAIPGWRESLPVKQDMFGRPVEAKDNFLNQFANPLRPSKVKGQGDITIAELRRLHNGDQGILPTAGKKNAFGDAGELQRGQVAELNRIAGGAQKSEYDKLIESPQYKSLNDEQKRAALKKLNSTVYGAEKNQYGQKLGLASSDDLEKDQQRYLQGSSVSFINKKKSDGSSADNVYVSDSLPTHYKKVLEDYDVMTAAEREKKFNSENDAEFKYKAAQYENQRLNGEIGEVENVKRRKELAKAELGSYVSKMTRDLYGMNKADIAYFLENHKDGQKLYNELVAYDQALYDKKLSTSRKFKNGLASGSGGGGGKGKGGKNKSGGVNLPSIDTSVSSDLSNPVVTRSSYKAPNLRLQRGGRVRMGRKATIKLKAPKKLA